MAFGAFPPLNLPLPFYLLFNEVLERFTLEQKVKIQDILITIPPEKVHGSFFFS